MRTVRERDLEQAVEKMLAARDRYRELQAETNVAGKTWRDAESEVFTLRAALRRARSR